MSLATWSTLLTAAIVISLTPGAGAVNTMTNAITQGWRRSIWGVMGQQIALIVQLLIVAVGVGALVAASPAILTAVKLLGAAYLVYLGVRMLLAKPKVTETERVEVVGDDAVAPAAAAAAAAAAATAATAPAGRRREPAAAMLRRGILVNLLNPKAIVFFLAFIPPFIRPDQPAAPQYLIIAATCVVVDVLVMWFGFALLARPLGRLMDTERGQRILNTIFGLCFILVAGLLFLVH
ncbi:LysE family transporter [Galactobacter caseinivorans]|uniref:Lysine transporter LysE n=1 Tax=Galactobacter caseinivorans TaxID=2676123 RepID=A0A496PLH2_9MICC|nr:LysE family transporter [Galactobacter caseinivorans]RKW71294.1 lysine transporter LysE [Galactobacter caseinivorans]